jgi:hypothetical protein
VAMMCDFSEFLSIVFKISALRCHCRFYWKYSASQQTNNIPFLATVLAGEKAKFGQPEINLGAFFWWQLKSSPGYLY